METRTHKKPDTIWLFDYPSLESLSDCPENLVLLSERDLNIIWQATLNIDRFRSRVFTEVDGQKYTIVDLDQWGNFREWVSDMNVNMGDFMACNELLQRIAEALESGVAMSNCCGGIEGVSGGSSGAEMEPAPPSDVEDTEESHSGPPPPGFDDWNEFDQAKCDWANKVLDDMVADVATMTLVNITGQAATALAGILVTLLITPVGWVILLEIAVIMIAAAATSGFYGFISTHLETYRDDYLCALVTGSDVTVSISNFGAEVDENIASDGNFNALTGYWASSILKSLCSIDSVNRMYIAQPFTPPTGDCSACHPGLIFPSTYGSCTPTLVAGSNSGPSATYRSCVTSAFGTDRALMTIASTETSLEREFSNWVLADGPDSPWVFAYVDENGIPQSINCDDLSDVPSPLLAESWQIVRGVPSDTTQFDLQFDVSSV